MDKKLPKVWVLYVTFARDREWMEYSLKSFKKYCKGFAGVTIVVPEWDVQSFLPLEAYGTPECPVWIKNFAEYPGRGFVHHLAMKCCADIFCPEADMVLHMDPDCLFSAPTDPQDYLVDGKPVLVIEPFEVLKMVHPARYNWKAGVEQALKFEVSHETMCRHPAIHHTILYKKMREHMESVHLTPFIDYVIKQKNSYPQGFSEYPTLGACAMQFYSKYYHFIDRKDQGDKADPVSHVWQGWSYEGVNADHNKKKIRELLG